MMTVEQILYAIDHGLTPNIPPDQMPEVEAAWSPEQRAKWQAVIDSIRSSYQTNDAAPAGNTAQAS